ncbi:hypothetical protein DXG01_010168 [Tephrocybe rancida]|nr:hypothetical protein DXG01_010168 [Tephrocybe rancida]
MKTPVIDTSRRFKIYAEDANKGVSIRFRGHVLELLRKTAKAYLAVIPGAEIFVDTAFDSLGDVLEKHGPEVERIAAKALDEIRKIAGDTENGLQAALKIMEVLRVRLVEIQALTKKIGDDLAPVAERAPEEIQLLAERLGPEAKRVVDERMAQVKTIVSQGASSSWENVKEQAARLSKSVGRSEEQPPANQSDKDHSPPTAHQEAAHKEESVSQDTTAK